MLSHLSALWVPREEEEKQEVAHTLSSACLCMFCAMQEGMRVCVGQRLAVNEAKITLAHIFRR